ncbi:MAG TPA: hypothetical protein VFA41_13115 [Ktedonobacteraceae bacterium]|jgi:hypothetical protein|nr:hypothetical protein [Ktedonobacteraceae bacterium]
MPDEQADDERTLKVLRHLFVYVQIYPCLIFANAMDVLHDLFAGGLFGLLYFILLGIFFLGVLLLSVATLLYQRKTIPNYSVDEVYTEYTRLRHPAARWRITLIYIVLLNAVFALLIVLLKGLFLWFLFVLLLVNPILLLWTAQQYDRVRLLTRRARELGLEIEYRRGRRV